MDDATYGHAESHAFPWIALLLLVAAFGAYAICFVMAAMTRKLSVLDYVAGTLGLGCGIGWMYFLYRANAVTLQHSFDMIEKGDDPKAARALNQRFKLAAGAAIVFGVLSYFSMR
jgi:hypothetical protein